MEESSYWDPIRVFAMFDFNFQLASIIAGFAVYGSSDGECENPVKTWVLVQAIYACVNFTLITIYLLFYPKRMQNNAIKIPYFAIVGLLTLFNVAWLITGSVWLFSDSDCYDDNYDSWAYTLAILIVHYLIYLGGTAFGISLAFKKKDENSLVS